MKAVLLIAAFAAIIHSTTAQAEPRTVTITASQHAKMITATWQCQDKIPMPRTRNHYYPWVPHSQAFRADQFNKWLLRYKKCQAFLTERARQWNWQYSVPEWARKLARCESSYNWWATATSRDGSFYSAFNILRSVYDKDAHHMGVRGWYEGPGVPSPVEQTWAVIGHMRLIGDGFAGNCHGIAQDHW